MADMERIRSTGFIGGGPLAQYTQGPFGPGELTEQQRAYQKLENRRFELEQIGYRYNDLYNLILSKDPTLGPDKVDELARAHMRKMAAFDPESEAPNA